MRNSSTPTTSEADVEASPTGWDATAGARVRRARALAVLAATAATLAVWAVTRLLGIEVAVRLGAPGTIKPVDPAVVVIVTVLAGLERLTASGRGWWTGLAAVALAISLTGPLGSGVTAGARASLTAMHLVAAAILIPVYLRTSRR